MKVYQLLFREDGYDTTKGIFSSAQKAADCAYRILPGVEWFSNDDGTPSYSDEARAPRGHVTQPIISIYGVEVSDVNIFEYELDEKEAEISTLASLRERKMSRELSQEEEELLAELEDDHA
jgi:hypothetical protein